MKRPAAWLNDRPHFFKYVTRATAKAVLNTCTLRWSVPLRFNDPFDIQFDLRVAFDAPSAKRRALEQLWEAHYGPKPGPVGNPLGAVVAKFRGVFPQLSREEFEAEFGKGMDETIASIDGLMPDYNAEVRQKMADVKILCLSEVHDNILMWSHYAEEHRGAVLKLRCIPELDSAWGAASAVQYTTEMPCLIDDDMFVRIMSGQGSIDPHASMRKMVYTKAIDWAYEKEWRICAGGGRSQAATEDLGFHAGELEAVYLGCRMSEADQLEIMDLVQQRFPGAVIMRARKADRTFSLVFEEKSHPAAHAVT